MYVLMQQSLDWRLTSIAAPHNGKAWKVRTHLQSDQIRYDTHPLELQHVPFRTALVHLGVLKVQAEGMQSLLEQSMKQ